VSGAASLRSEPKKLGSGGEADVYAVADRPGLAGDARAIDLVLKTGIPG